MTINFLDEQQFTETLYQFISPSQPIRSTELLKGRDSKLQSIKEGFHSPGRQVFIYGDRGVGKTSLALTAAILHHPSESDPILVACDSSSTFAGITRDIMQRVLAQSIDEGKAIETKSAGVNFRGLNYQVSKETEKGILREAKSVNEAIEIAKFVSAQAKSTPVVVVDEFDRISEQQERMLFADFIKQIGDQDVDIKMIFCGVADAITELITAHHSCFRYLSCIELERLSWDARFEIINASADALSVIVDRNTQVRIAAISDGFPHYVHLICEKLYWSMFRDEHQANKTTAAHFNAAVRNAVTDIAPQLKEAYDKATKKYKGGAYEPVLWAAADHPNLERKSADIYESYKRIMADYEQPPLTRDQFNQRMNNLKKPSHGEILKGTRQGWYQFRENIVRGYVRLKAEDNGVKLDIDHYSQRRSLGT